MSTSDRDFGSAFNGAGARVDTLFGAVSQANNRELLEQARDMIQARISAMLTATIAIVERDLFATADASRIGTEQTILLDAMLRLREFRTQLAHEFQTEFTSYFERALQGTLDEDEIQSDTGTPWSLVGDDEVAEATVITDLARRAKNSLDHMQLFEVRMRLAELLSIDPDDDAANPLAPEAIFGALLRACERMPAAPQARRATLAAFHPYVTREIEAAYAEVNQFLLENNVAAPIRPFLQTSRQMDSADASADTGEGGDRGGVDTAGGFGGGSRGSAVASGRSSNERGIDGGSSRVPGRVTGAESRLQKAIGNLLGTEPERTTLVDALTQVLAQPPEARRMVVRMLADPARHGFESALSVPPSAKLLNALTTHQASGRAQAEIAADVRADSHPLDLLTMEFVTLVFEALLSDKAITSPVRAEIGRLQIVAVKAAMLDRTFFANRRHPMRRLLDHIATLAMDVEIDAGEGTMFHHGLREIVDGLVVDFNTDLSLFATAMQALDGLHKRCRAEAAQAVAATTVTIEAVEERERKLTTCLAEIRRRAGSRAPLVVRTFLEEWWVQVLVKCYGDAAPDTNCWQQRLSVVDQLVWSVSSLSSTEVKRLALMLPSIMLDLRQGMESVDMPVEAREEFFVKLMALHTHTIQRAKARAVTASELSAIPEEIVAQPEPKPAAALTIPLRVGSLVELTVNGSAKKMKLVWISSSRQTYVFSSREHHTHAVPALALADALRAGRARAISTRESVIDRLINRVTSPQ